MRHPIKRIAGSLYTVVGVVLIWRGVWVIFENVERSLFGHDTIAVAVLGIIAGIILLYLHDHRADELGHL